MPSPDVDSSYQNWYIPVYVSSLCMHQIWYTKFTTNTWHMANVKWSIRRVQDVWLTYTTYSPCSPSIPWVHEVYDLVYGVWPFFNEAYDLHRTYGWRTKSLVRVHQVYLCIIGDIWSNVCTKFGTRSIRPGVWRMSIFQWSIRPAQDLWLTYKESSPCTPSIPMYHRWYMV